MLERPPSGRLTCHVLVEDPDLAEAIEPEQRRRAIDVCVAPEMALPAGVWRRTAPARMGGGLGFLVLEGVLIQRVQVDARFGAEVLGEGDVLRPPESRRATGPLDWQAQWLVLEAARLAILDEAFVRQMADYPPLAGRLFARAVTRSRQMVINLAIIHQARVDVRLHMLLWHLAGRWGRVRADGVLVPLRLTHALLSDLVAARRPTVTSALSDLARRGLVRSVRDGWLLSGQPPGEAKEASRSTA